MSLWLYPTWISLRVKRFAQMNDPRIITVTIGQREFQRKDFFFRYGGHDNKLHQWRSKFVFHIMFILEYNLYKYSSNLMFGGKI